MPRSIRHRLDHAPASKQLAAPCEAHQTGCDGRELSGGRGAMVRARGIARPRDDDCVGHPRTRSAISRPPRTARLVSVRSRPLLSAPGRAPPSGRCGPGPGPGHVFSSSCPPLPLAAGRPRVSPLERAPGSRRSRISRPADPSVLATTAAAFGARVGTRCGHTAYPHCPTSGSRGRRFGQTAAALVRTPLPGAARGPPTLRPRRGELLPVRVRSPHRHGQSELEQPARSIPPAGPAGRALTRSHVVVGPFSPAPVSPGPAVRATRPTRSQRRSRGLVIRPGRAGPSPSGRRGLQARPTPRSPDCCGTGVSGRPVRGRKCVGGIGGRDGVARRVRTHRRGQRSGCVLFRSGRGRRPCRRHPGTVRSAVGPARSSVTRAPRRRHVAVRPFGRSGARGGEGRGRRRVPRRLPARPPHAVRAVVRAVVRARAPRRRLRRAREPPSRSRSPAGRRRRRRVSRMARLLRVRLVRVGPGADRGHPAPTTAKTWPGRRRPCRPVEATGGQPPLAGGPAVRPLERRRPRRCRSARCPAAEPPTGAGVPSSSRSDPARRRRVVVGVVRLRAVPSGRPRVAGGAFPPPAVIGTARSARSRRPVHRRPPARGHLAVPVARLASHARTRLGRAPELAPVPGYGACWVPSIGDVALSVPLLFGGGTALQRRAGLAVGSVRRCPSSCCPREAAPACAVHGRSQARGRRRNAVRAACAPNAADAAPGPVRPCAAEVTGVRHRHRCRQAAARTAMGSPRGGRAMRGPPSDPPRTAHRRERRRRRRRVARRRWRRRAVVRHSDARVGDLDHDRPSWRAAGHDTCDSGGGSSWRCRQLAIRWMTSRWRAPPVASRRLHTIPVLLISETARAHVDHAPAPRSAWPVRAAAPAGSRCCAHAVAMLSSWKRLTAGPRPARCSPLLDHFIWARRAPGCAATGSRTCC